MRQWKHLFLTAEFIFVRLDEKDMSMYAFQLREDAIARSAQVGWTSLQRVQMIIREKHIMESRGGKVTAARWSGAFTSNVCLARSSEPMTASFVDIALTIESRILSSDTARGVLELF